MGESWETQVFKNKHPEINEFLQRKEDLGRSPRTLNAYSRTLKKFYHQHFPELTPQETQVRHIEEYLSILGKRDLSQNTKRRYLESVSAFFSWALKRPRFDDINGNPAAVLLEELPKKIRQRPDCATWENASKIVQQIGDPRDKTVAAILAKTGCRANEALQLEESDLLLDQGFIRLRVRKGGKQTVVPIDDELRDALERYQFIRQETDEDYLFVSMKGGRIKRERIRRSVTDAAVEAGVVEEGASEFHKKFTPHTFRTVFTTLMRNRGMSDHVLQYIRGDSKSETMDIYTRVDRDKAREEYLTCIKNLGI